MTSPSRTAASIATPPAVTRSVILVNHNGRAEIVRCLQSLRWDDTAAEIIVVDNASTDGSADLIAQAFPEVRLVRSPVNGGFGAGNNLGVRAASGEILLFLNPDTVVEPNWATPLLAALEDPTVGLATAKILLRDSPERVNACGNEIHCSGLTLCRGIGELSDAFTASAEVAAISGAAFAIRRDVYSALGGFDEDFFLYLEDTDLSLRARLAGFRCVCAPDSVVYHDYTLRFGPKKTFYQERNRYRLLLKTYRWRTLAVLAPSLLLAEAVAWGFVLLREPGRYRNKLGAYLAIVRGWRQIMGGRRRAQALRQVGDRALLAATTDRLGFEQVGGSWSVSLAHLVFDPLFLIGRHAALLLVCW